MATLRWRSPALVGACVAGLGALVVGLVQLRDGIIPMLDTVTYWSGASRTADGHWFSTSLAPSFSNFDAAEFVSRGGHLPFVDFPVGYPTAAGLLGTVTSASTGLQVVTLASLTAIGALLVAGGRPDDRPLDVTTVVFRVAVALLAIALPVTRLVTQATLSEPVFGAIVLGMLASLVRYRRTGHSWWWGFALGATGGLFRFLGAPLALLPAVELWRRERHVGRAIGAFAAGVAPAAVNVAWVSAAGGGHRAGWRGLAGEDVRTFARSVGGWFASELGDLRLTYFSADRSLPWWVRLVTLAWLLAMLAAGCSFVGLWPRRWWRMPAPLELCLVASGILTAGLIVGLLGFDALVIPDNRLLLPMGLITLAGVIWSVRVPATAVGIAVAAAVVLVWSATAVRPDRLRERFTDDRDYAYADVAAASGARVIVTNAADDVHWRTGIPAAYLPLPERALTGERVDQEAELRALPCPMYREGGAIVAAPGAFFGLGGTEVLDALVAEGRLMAEPAAGGTLYLPTETACDP